MRKKRIFLKVDFEKIKVRLSKVPVTDLGVILLKNFLGTKKVRAKKSQVISVISNSDPL